MRYPGKGILQCKASTFEISESPGTMEKVFLLVSVYIVCTISLAWGCVTGAGPSWDISKQGRPGLAGRPGKVSPDLPGVVRPVIPPGLPGNKGEIPRIPVAVVRYFAGVISKEAAFGSIDLDGNGLVSLKEWTLSGGAVTEFDLMLTRLDIDGDNLISLVELQPYSLPTESKSDIPILLDPRIKGPRPGPRGPIDPRGPVEPRDPVDPKSPDARVPVGQRGLQGMQ